MYSGAFTALITPFDDGGVDAQKLRELVDFQISEGIDGLVPCGTTGETPTLSDEEQALVIKTVVDQTSGRVPVLAGAGANSTAKAIKQSAMATECGADALLHVSPYYNKPPQHGLVAHFSAVHDATTLPIVLYNVPARTGGDILPETVSQLAQLERIVGIKEATGSIIRAQKVIATCPADFAILSGEDLLAFTLTAAGGHGVISVTSNIAPREFSDLISLTRSGKIDEARTLHYKLQRLIELMFMQSNPIPIKAAMALKGLTKNQVRSPMLPLDPKNVELLAEELRTLNLI